MPLSASISCLPGRHIPTTLSRCPGSPAHICTPHAPATLVCGFSTPPDLETAAMLAADALEQRADAEQQQQPVLSSAQSPAPLDAATSLRLAAQLREQVSARLAGYHEGGVAARHSGLGGCW